MTGEEQETHEDNAVMDIGNGFYTFGMQIAPRFAMEHRSCETIA